MVDEALPIALCLKVDTEGRFTINALVVQIGQNLAVKTQDILQHAPESGGHQVTTLREQRVQAMAVVFETSTWVMHRKAHLRGLRGNL
ncbi:hypothetical protein D9M71_641010 [compost metagenome]